MTQVIHEIIIIGILSKIVLLMKNMELYYNCNCIRWRSHDIKSCSWIESRDLNRADLFPILRAITESDEISHLAVPVRMENSGQKFGAEVCPTLFGSFSAETHRPKISCYSESARIVAEIGRLRPLSEPFSTENSLSKNSEMIPLFARSDLWCNEIQFS